jgi:hypothetical protein
MLLAFKEVVGQVSKSKMDNAMSSKWQCIHTQTETQPDSSKFAPFCEKIADKGPVFFLCSGKSSHGKKVVLGGYTSSQMPVVVINEDEEEDGQDYPVSAN